MFARAAGRNFACRPPVAAVGEPSSAALCASVLAFAVATALGLVVDTGCFGASPAGTLTAVLGLISTKGGLEDSLSATAVDCVFEVSVNESAGFSFAPSLAPSAAFDASDCTAAWRWATEPAAPALCSGFGSVCFATD